MKVIKRYIAFLISVLLLASSMSVGFTAFAAELTSLNGMCMEDIQKNDANIGTATHYEYQWNPAKNWEELQSLASEGTAELNFKNIESAIHTHTGDGVYTSKASESYKKVTEVNGLGADGNSYKCDNGTFFSAEVQTLYSCSNAATHAEGCDGTCTSRADVVTKQHGWDAEGYYYYDYYNEDGNGLVHTFGADVNWSSVKLRD